jgi:hypothetical protein
MLQTVSMGRRRGRGRGWGKVRMRGGTSSQEPLGASVSLVLVRPARPTMVPQMGTYRIAILAMLELSPALCFKPQVAAACLGILGGMGHLLTTRMNKFADDGLQKQSLC